MSKHARLIATMFLVCMIGVSLVHAGDLTPPPAQSPPPVEPVATIDKTQPGAVAFSPTEPTIAVAGSNAGSITLWKDGKSEWTDFHTVANGIQRLFFSSDGQYLVAYAGIEGWPRNTAVWHLDSKKRVYGGDIARRLSLTEEQMLGWKSGKVQFSDNPNYRTGNKWSWPVLSRDNRWLFYVLGKEVCYALVEPKGKLGRGPILKKLNRTLSGEVELLGLADSRLWVYHFRDEWNDNYPYSELIVWDVYRDVEVSRTRDFPLYPECVDVPGGLVAGTRWYATPLKKGGRIARRDWAQFLVWDVDGRRVTNKLSPAETTLEDVGELRLEHATFSSDTKVLAISDDQGAIWFWNLEQDRLAERFFPPTLKYKFSISAIDFSPSGEHLAICNGDERVELWDARRWTGVP